MEELISWVALILSIIAFTRVGNVETKVQKLSKAVDAAAVALGLKPAPVKSQAAANTNVSAPKQTSNLNLTSSNNSEINMNTNSEVARKVEDVKGEEDLVIDTGNRSPKDNSKPDPFIAWVMDNWMMKLGVGLILIGFVWALNYAYEAKFLTNTGISVLGILVGLGVLTFGFIRAKLYVRQGSIFMLLGTGLIMLTAYFMKIMEVVSNPYVLMLIMVLALAVTSAAAVLYNVASLSIASLVLALLVPAILSTGDNNYLGLYIYLLVVVISTIWVVAITRWRVLTLIALIGVCVYSASGVIFGFGTYTSDALVFVFVFAGIFFLTNTISLLRNRDLIDVSASPDQGTAMPDIIAAVLNVAMLVTIILTTMAKEWHILVLSLIAVVFVMAAYLIYKNTKNPLPFFTYAGIAGALLAYVTFLALGDDYKALAAAYTLEIGALSLLTYILSQKVEKASQIMILFGIPLVLILPSIKNIVGNVTSISNYVYDYYKYDYNYTTPNNLGMDFAVAILFMAVTVSLASYYYFKTLDKDVSLLNMVLGINGLIFLAIIWGLCVMLSGEFAGKVLSLIIYAVIGVCAYVYGKNRDLNLIKYAGGVLVGFTIYVLLETLDNIDTDLKVVGLSVIGFVLLLSAFILKKKN